MISTYAASGVNIDAGNRAVELMRDAVRSTYSAKVLAGIGAFGGLFDASEFKQMRAPVLVASTDGVGTKLSMAVRAHRLENVGHDIVNHCVNDILVQGATPLFFLDYIASSKLVPEHVATIVKSMAEACVQGNIALLGGETAEMPGVYADREMDVAGTIIGVVERENILPRDTVKAGDVLVGLRSNGAHTNGYSLIRRVWGDVGSAGWQTQFASSADEANLLDVLLAPHRSYLSVLKPFLAQASPLKALAHITGGGILENLPRVLPPHLGAHIRLNAWETPELFRLIQQRGGIATEEMFRVFNMGIAMIAIVAAADVGEFQARIGEESFVIGEIIEGEHRVRLG